MTAQFDKPFRTDENTLWLLINNQAQSHEKSILEGIMNSIDAQSAKVNIITSPTKIVISDIGKGFRNNEEISKFFSSIGTPHTKGDAKFGRFRMGRCQMFKYGKNIWRSNTFQMTVDIKNWGKEHEIASNLPQHDGCEITIELYDPLSSYEIASITRNLQHWVAWSDTPITINGKEISRNPADFPDFWTKETPEAYIYTDNSDTLSLYNMGIYVTSYPASKYGTGGIVTTKENLDLIYARNDVSDSCKIWKKIKQEIASNAGDAINPEKLGDDDIKWLSHQIADETLDIEKFSPHIIRIIGTGATTKSTPMSLLHAYMNEAPAMCVITEVTPLTRHIQKESNILLVNQETLDNFGVQTINDLVQVIAQGLKASYIKAGKHNYSGRIVQGIINSEDKHPKLLTWEEIQSSIKTKTYKPIRKAALPEPMKKLQSMLAAVLNKTATYAVRAKFEVEFAHEVSDGEPVIFTKNKTISLCYHPDHFYITNPTIADISNIYKEICRAIAKKAVSDPSTMEKVTKHNSTDENEEVEENPLTETQIFITLVAKIVPEATTKTVEWIGENMRPGDESPFNTMKVSNHIN